MELGSGSKMVAKPLPADAAKVVGKYGYAEIRYLPTPDMPVTGEKRRNLVSGLHWKWTPSGRFGVAIKYPVTNWRGETSDPMQLVLYDVYNKIWFSRPIAHRNVSFNDLFTYHMVNETELVIVEMSGDSCVKQHLYQIDMEKRKADYSETVTHTFMRRDMPLNSLPPWKTKNSNSQTNTHHIPVKIKRNYYTALVSGRTGLNLRRTIYLVPLHPKDPHAKPMEYSVNLELSADEKGVLDSVIRSERFSFDFRREVLSNENVLHLIPIVKSELFEKYFSGIGYGVYRTVDVTKLINIHEKNIDWNSDEEKDLDEKQAAGLAIRRESYAAFVNSEIFTFCSGAPNGDFVTKCYQNDFVCHALAKNSPMELPSVYMSWPCTHPCGALILFLIDQVSGQLFVKTVNSYKTSLFALTVGKVLFKKTDLTEKVFDERMHRLVFGMGSLKLDDDAKKALQPYEEWCGLFKQDREI